MFQKRRKNVIQMQMLDCSNNVDKEVEKIEFKDDTNQVKYEISMSKF